MAVEIGTAYLSIVASTSGIPKQLRSALGTASSIADQEGQAAGNRLASGLGKTLKVGGVAAMAAAGTAMGVALTKGFDRLSAIDDAKGKLTGLGHSTQSTAKIMDSALASVKGTAFGLGDAATIAASAVAAGIKPGKDLTKYLTLTADAASIAGTSLDEMGSIINGVETSGVAMGDSLSQLSDRGIPILQWIGKEMGVTAGEVSDLASEGKVSSEIFKAAIEKNIGGAAQASGKTVKGAAENVLAALGRMGAAAEGPTFKRLPATFTAMTASIDAATPAVAQFAESLDSKVFDEWVPKAQDAWDTFSQSEFAADAAMRLAGVWGTLTDTATEAAPAVAQIARSLGIASGALGVSSWQIFLSTLEAGATVLSALAPILSTIGNLMESNQGAVTALAAAYLLFRTVPGLMGRVAAPLASMTAGAAAAAAQMRTLGTATGATIRTSTMGTVAMGRFGSSIAAVGGHVPAIARMQQSYMSAAAGAQHLARTQGAMAAGMAGLRGGAGALASVFGGPLAMGVTAAAIGGVAWFSSMQKGRAEARAYQEALAKLSEEQRKTGQALLESGGQLNDSVMSSLTAQVERYQASTEAAGKADAKWADVAGDAVQELFTLGNATADTASKKDEAAAKAQAAQRAFSQLGLTSEQVAKTISGNAATWESLKTRLENSGSGGRQTAADLQVMRTEFERTREAARRLSPGFAELHDAVTLFGDSTASAAEKSDALKAALDRLNPARSANEAMSDYNDTVREVTASLGEGVDQADGFGASLGGIDGVLKGTTVNGADLSDELDRIVERTGDVAAKGGDMGRVFAENQTLFQGLATKFGLSMDEIVSIANQKGLDDIDLIVKLKGADQTVAELTMIGRRFQELPAGQKTLEVAPGDLTQETREALEKIDFTVNEITRNGVTTVQVTPKTEEAQRRLDAIMTTVTSMPPNKNIQIGAPGGDAVYALLTQLGARVVTDNDKNIVVQSPLAPQVLGLMNNLGLAVRSDNGKDIIVTSNAVAVKNDVDALNRSTAAVPRAIDVVFNFQQTGTPPPRVGTNNQAVDSVLGAFPDANADGSVRQYNGATLPDQALIQRPDPNGGLVQWAEPETGGEAFIPLARSKRSRSLKIWEQTGRLLGRKFANGGIRADDLDRLAMGQSDGAPPLTGNPYNWGGVRWGDCSSAMSAFARKAAGLDVFGGRFATGSMASALQQMGAVMGRGSSGDLRFGWYNGGEGGGHTAGTLPSGKNVEMGGGYGGGMYGGSVGADDPQFTDHAYFPASMFGTMVASFVPRPNNFGDTVPDPNYQSSAGTATAPGAYGPQQSPEQKIASSFSENLGNAAKAFVTGQTTDALGVFGISDSPGWLGAWSKYQQDNTSAGEQAKVTDPGTQKPNPGEDLGGQTPTQQAPALGFTPTGDAVKDAVKAALLDKGWADGPEWSAVDWIFGKEATWNPKAVNPTSGAFGLPQFNPSSGTLQQYLPDRSTDPAVQADAFERYIDDRYDNSPSKAKDFHVNNGWYDEGGFLPPGQTLVTNNTGKPEPVLNPQQWAAIQKGGGSEVHNHYEQINHNPVYASESEAQKRYVDYQRRQLMRAGGR